MYMVFLSPSKSSQFTQHRYTSHHFTYLRSISTTPLPLTTFSTLFLNVFVLQGKDASKQGIIS
jgi:hypothetical protein